MGCTFRTSFRVSSKCLILAQLLCSATDSQPASIRMTSVGQDMNQDMTLSGLTFLRSIQKSRFTCLWEAETSCIAIGWCFHNSLIPGTYDISVMREPDMQVWIKLKPEEKKNYSVTEAMSFAIDKFYFTHYCRSFRRGAFARANSSMYIVFIISLMSFH